MQVHRPAEQGKGRTCRAAGGGRTCTAHVSGAGLQLLEATGQHSGLPHHSHSLLEIIMTALSEASRSRSLSAAQLPSACAPLGLSGSTWAGQLSAAETASSSCTFPHTAANAKQPACSAPGARAYLHYVFELLHLHPYTRALEPLLTDCAMWPFAVAISYMGQHDRAWHLPAPARSWPPPQGMAAQSGSHARTAHTPLHM